MKRILEYVRRSENAQVVLAIAMMVSVTLFICAYMWSR